MRRYFAIALGLTIGLSVVADIAQAGGRLRFFNGQRVPHGHPIGMFTEPYDDHTKMVICSNRPVPPNWIIVGVQNTPGCNGLGNNSWIIQRLPNYPGADIIICGDQPIPPGWGVVESVKNIYCGSGHHGVRIRKL